jgi:hypothetical protein
MHTATRFFLTMTDPALEEFMLFGNASDRIGMAAIGKDFYDAHSTGS